MNIILKNFVLLHKNIQKLSKKKLNCLFFRGKIKLTTSSKLGIIIQVFKVALIIWALIKGEIMNYQLQSVQPYLQLGDESYNSCTTHLFTKRELDILLHAVYGSGAKKIGLMLKISHRTVEKHLESIKDKLHCKKKSEIPIAFFKNARLQVLLFKQPDAI